jgi:predicted dehydrogenase
MDRIGIGIIGFGRIGAEHAAWIDGTSTLRVAAVADATPARRVLAESRGLHAIESVDELLANPGVNAVLVSTPTAMHFAHASQAIAAGKHVMIEKPTTLDLAQAVKLVEQAKSARRVLSVFHNRRWDIDYLTVKAAIDARRFGRLINIESRLGQWSSCVGPAAKEYRPNWRNEAEYGGGGLYDWGSHFVDQVWRLLWPSRPVRVFAQLRGNVWSRDCDDFARVAIDFDNGCCAMVEINTTTTRPLPRWHVDGTEGSAEGPYSLSFDTRQWAELDFAPANGGQSWRLPTAPPGLSEIVIWERFAAAITGSGEPAVPVASVLPTMALLDAARESARTGAAVRISPTLGWIY